MMTPYINPYIAQLNPQQQQEVGGLMPVFQNIGQQQAMQNAALAQQNQLVSQAGQTAQGGGMNPLAMAMMLRKGKEDPYAKNQGNPYLNAQTAMNMYGAGNVYGFGGQGQVPTTTTGMD